MSELEEKILLSVKNHFIKNREPIRLEKIYWLFNFYEENKIKHAIKTLVEGKKLIMINQRFVPIMEEMRETEISADKIKHVLEITGGATPEQIYEKYRNFFGRCNPDSLGREVRRLAEKGKIKRENGRYFLNESTKTKNLLFFAIK